jgi:SAM-dependent methyltransferase
VCDAVNLGYLERQFHLFRDCRTVLEVGSYDVNGTCRGFIQSKGLDYLGVDLQAGPGVDLVCDMGAEPAAVTSVLGARTFDLVVCMNVLEHTYEPIRVLDNIRRLMSPKGHLVVVTPLVWDLHNWPADYYRLNPDFYRRYASTSGLDIVPDSFVFSVRDTRKFYADTSVIPELVPHIYGRTPAGLAITALSVLLRPLRHAWPHV